MRSITPTKNLRSGQTVWSFTRHRPLLTHGLKGAVKCDVAIIGAGVSGAFMAEELSRHYGNVVVLDRRAPASGSTHASTAMLQYEIDTPLTELADRMGWARAARVWRLSAKTVQDMIRLIRRERIACDLQTRNSLYLAGDAMGSRGLAGEARARHRAGLECQFLNAAALNARFGIARTGAIHSSGHASADPVALARGLLRRARSRGAHIYAPCDVTGVLANHKGVMLNAGGHFIEARAAVFCTGYERLTAVPDSGTRIVSSWAAATGPHSDYPDWLDRTLVWEAADPYLYMRSDGQGRLIVGGEDAGLDSPGLRARTLGGKARMLAAKTKALFGVKPHWKHVWAGAFGDSADGLPVIDAVPGLPHCFAVMGFGGNGTIYSRMAAKLMPGLIKGRPSPNARLFFYR